MTANAINDATNNAGARPDWDALAERHEIAFLRADVCLGSPQSYTLAEKAAICDEMEASTAEIDRALREDFAAMPPELQARMLDMLCAADPQMAGWWRELLVGKMPDSPDELKAPQPQPQQPQTQP